MRIFCRSKKCCKKCLLARIAFDTADDEPSQVISIYIKLYTYILTSPGFSKLKSNVVLCQGSHRTAQAHVGEGNDAEAHRGDDERAVGLICTSWVNRPRRRGGRGYGIIRKLLFFRYNVQRNFQEILRNFMNFCKVL